MLLCFDWLNLYIFFIMVKVYVYVYLKCKYIIYLFKVYFNVKCYINNYVMYIKLICIKNRQYTE